jgi:integrase/recombinase XerD
MVLESLFKQRTLASTLARHLAAPLLQEREAFLLHLQREGTNANALKRYAPVLIQINRFLGLKTLRDVQLDEVHQATKRWRNHLGLPTFVPKENSSGPHFTWLAKRWLCFHGRLKLPPRPVQPFAAKLTSYAEFMRYRGLVPETVQGRCKQAAQFLRWFSQKHRSLRFVCVNDVDRFLLLRRAGGWSPLTVATAASALRSFFAYAGSRRWCNRGLASGIERPLVPRHRFLRRGPNWREIQQVLRGLGTRPADVRARAIMSLLAVYALRASEVSRLLLSDLDWKTKVLNIKRSKRGRFQRFPIQRQVGDALTKYITKIRPQCSCPNTFVTLHPPFRPVPHATIWKIINARLGRLGIKRRPCGAHSVRHACATYLLQRGSSLREIGDFLGHRDVRSASIYARCDMKSLRAVADFDLGYLR